MYDRLKKLHDSDEYPMHMPGHKRKHGFGQIDGAVDVVQVADFGFRRKYLEGEGLFCS